MLAPSCSLAAEAATSQRLHPPHDINEVIWGTDRLPHRRRPAHLEGPAGRSRTCATGRTERIAKELDDADGQAPRPRAKLADVAAPHRRRRRGAAPHPRRGRRHRGDVAQGPAASPRPTPTPPSMRRPGPPPTSRPPRRRPSPTSQAEVGALAIGAAEAVVANNLDDATQSELVEKLHQPGRVPRLMSDRSNALRRAFLAVHRGRGPLERGPGRAVPLRPHRSRATTSCARRLTDPHLPAERAPADRRGPPRRQGQPVTIALVSLRRRHRPGPRAPRHRRPAARAHRRGRRAGRGRGPLGRRAHRRPERPPRRRPRAGHRQGGRGQGHRRPDGARRHRHPDRRHRHRRLRPPPSRPAPRVVLKPQREPRHG